MAKYLLSKTGTLEAFTQVCDRFGEAQERMANHLIKDKYYLDGFTFARKRKWGYLVSNGADYSKLHIYKINMI